MLELKPWLSVQPLTVRDFARDLDVPLKTAQGWVYQGVVPSAENQSKVVEYMRTHCAHYWVIAVPNGPISEGVCQRCGHRKGFENSEPEHRWPGTKPRGSTYRAAQDK